MSQRLQRRLTHALVLLVVLLLSQVTPSHADPAPTFQLGFAQLKASLGDAMGDPVTDEYPAGDDSGFVVQETTTGLAYWQHGYAPTWTNGWLRVALVQGDLLDWEGDALAPPVRHESSGVSGGESVAWLPPGDAVGNHIRATSRYGQRAACVAYIESTWGIGMYNPISVGGEHAQGYFGWLPSTARSVGATINHLDSEIAGFDRMIDNRRGNEFHGINVGRC